MGEVIQFPKDRWQHDDLWTLQYEKVPYCPCNDCYEDNGEYTYLHFMMNQQNRITDDPAS